MQKYDEPSVNRVLDLGFANHFGITEGKLHARIRQNSFCDSTSTGLPFLISSISQISRLLSASNFEIVFMLFFPRFANT